MPIFSADDYFMVEGSYKFDPSKISDAHAACFARFLEALHDTRIDQVILMSGIPGSGKSTLARKMDNARTLIVDNTNLKAWEVSPYILAANAFGIRSFIYRVFCDKYKAFARQTHGVPLEAHNRMAEDFYKRDVLPWWDVISVEPGDEP